MSAVSTPYGDDDTFVIIVKAKEFYESLIGRKIQPSSFQFEPSDSNYKKLCDAEHGFSLGESNPVPLAEVGYYKSIGFTNGITRTMWLIKNGAVCFPVECSSRRSAVALYEKFSYMNFGIYSISELIHLDSKRRRVWPERSCEEAGRNL
jgi:hypothetical protein